MTDEERLLLAERLETATERAKETYQSLKLATREGHGMIRQVRDKEWIEKQIEKMVNETLASYHQEVGIAREKAVARVSDSFTKLGNLYRYGVEDPAKGEDLAQLAEQWRRRWVETTMRELGH